MIRQRGHLYNSHLLPVHLLHYNSGGNIKISKSVLALSKHRIESNKNMQINKMYFKLCILQLQ